MISNEIKTIHTYGSHGNPQREGLTLQKPAKVITIFDAMGKRVYAQPQGGAATQTIDVGTWGKGVYTSLLMMGRACLRSGWL
ncbi:MAG TPA: hypothetical protein VIU12_34470 [Chryseolinea sp.]